MSAIRSTLELVRTRLDSFLKVSVPDPHDDHWVTLSNVVDQEGHPYKGAKDKIVMFLAGIQHETTISTYSPTVRVAQNQYGAVSPPLYVNLQVLFYANFVDDNYKTGLGMISRTISFFQQNPYFTQDTLPGLDPVIDKIAFEFSNLDIVQANYLMGMMGVKYLPTVLYKVRVLPFRSDAISAVVPPAQTADNNAEGSVL